MGGGEAVSARRGVGLGAATTATVGDCVALVRETLALASGPSGPSGPSGLGWPTVLASVDRREALARVVAAEFGFDVVLLGADELAATRGVVFQSVAALHAIGTPSVAEAAALRAVGRDATLRIARRTGRRCTCAIAERA